MGNLLVLMMADRNDYAPPVGRIVAGRGRGGRPAGAVTLETFQWWRNQVEEHRDAIVLSAHHSVPMSRLLTFVEGRNEIRVQCYLHTDRHAPRGWYAKAERTLTAAKPFSLT